MEIIREIFGAFVDFYVLGVKASFFFYWLVFVVYMLFGISTNQPLRVYPNVIFVGCVRGTARSWMFIYKYIENALKYAIREQHNRD